MVDKSESRSESELEESLQNLSNYDSYAGLRAGLAAVAAERGDWAGIPLPIDNLCLVVEPNYPYAGGLLKTGLAIKPISVLDREIDTQTMGRIRIRNRFWSFKFKTMAVVYERLEGPRKGKVYCQPEIGTSNCASYLLDTLLASEAWGIEQESRALVLLAHLIPHHAFKKYLLTGMFVESSKRSGVAYVFRKLRPTIALSVRKYEGDVAILCTLCMHPIGYYTGSWGGVMCPTDDVIAHLMLMRGDEPMFWRRCNQHAPHRPESGL